MDVSLCSLLNGGGAAAAYGEDYVLSEELFSGAVDRFPCDKKAYFNLALLCSIQKRDDDAKTYISKLKGLEPLNDDNYDYRVSAFECLLDGVKENYRISRTFLLVPPLIVPEDKKDSLLDEHDLSFIKLDTSDIFLPPFVTSDKPYPLYNHGKFRYGVASMPNMLDRFDFSRFPYCKAWDIVCSIGDNGKDLLLKKE